MRRALSLLALLVPAALLAGCDSATFNDNNIGCDRVHSFSLGNSASGTLDTGDCVLTDGSAVELYRFRINDFRTVYVSASSNNVDPYVEILDQSGNVIAEEDNGGSGYSELTTDLSSGTYYIAVTTYQPGDYGDFVLDTDYQ